MHLAQSGDPLSVTAGDMIAFDTAERWMYHMEGTVNTVTIAKDAGIILSGELSIMNVLTSAAHGLAVDDVIRIEGNSVWNGFYTVVDIGGANTFSTWLDPQFVPPASYSNVATVRKCNSLWANTITITDLANWLWLEPGNNDIAIDTGSDDLDTGTLTVTFYDTYA